MGWCLWRWMPTCSRNAVAHGKNMAFLWPDVQRSSVTLLIVGNDYSLFSQSNLFPSFLLDSKISPGDFKFLLMSASCRFMSSLSYNNLHDITSFRNVGDWGRHSRFKPYLLYLPKAAFLCAELKIPLEDCAALFIKLGTIFWCYLLFA